ncbi:hypothetical protein A2526_03025 [candidate division WOR-1 bacterium RIFOXYD2_FULL_36_8]|uniref:Uncharacterized protein n=1 Tax=candidate division WOR-1 bacterium RIFOXYB2_FULL_36_35 TaxID=1802578 RepID=A0A1F4S7S1_UNCSA|nr:MAG: hypothetical protein A2230_05110 [candidate division WOR-1 bacterium RIFOXYA2_FULL_36_21]OGC15783.1 MAG: hypothetical protein A2290_05535 [candidate division WOR-1 bacterium RIFOXYB2_FULL_36_35]OGC18979.1 MAG: hypothetical protein A2282_09305 [candidate division WOR-1 bacterium RIFOXYA12_FULL_36_13]OGC39299.1 MAG: hypothetical protein A2526_03025 [candidate division WOR-1 bacterium RIFOXYD2_FULL_36_8]
MAFSVKFVSPSSEEIKHSSDFDVISTSEAFFNEMSYLLKSYADLSLHPDSTKTMNIGNVKVTAAEIDSPAVSLLLQDRLSVLEQANNAILDIWNSVRKLEDKLGTL